MPAKPDPSGPPIRARPINRILNHQAARFLMALGPTGVALVFQFATFAVTARGLGVAQFGQYATIIAIAAILIEFVGLGGSDLLVRAVARDPQAMPAYFGNLLLLTGATIVPVTLLGVGLILGPIQTNLQATTVVVGLFGEIIAARISASSELVMIAHGHTFHASCVRILTGITRFGAALLFFAHSRALDGWVWAVLAQAILLSAMLLGYLVWRYGGPVWRWHRSETGAGMAFSLNQTARAAQSNIDRIVLSHFASNAVVGVYAAGARLLVVGQFPIQVMTRILYPNFFRHGAEGIATSRRYAIRCIPPMLAVSAVSLLAIVLVAQLLPGLLGHDFLVSRNAAEKLALAMPLIAMQYLGADTLTGAGYQHLRSYVSAGASVGFGFAMAFGAYMAGINGVIAAFLACQAIHTVIIWTIALRLK